MAEPAVTGAVPSTVGPSAARPASPRRKWTDSPHLWFWVFVGPFVAGLLVFIVIPILWSVWLSFYDARNTVTPTHFVGFENYSRMLGDSAFRSSLVTFVLFAAFIVPTTFVLSLGLAVLVTASSGARRSSGRSSSCRRPAVTSSRR